MDEEPGLLMLPHPENDLEIAYMEAIAGHFATKEEIEEALNF